MSNKERDSFLFLKPNVTQRGLDFHFIYFYFPPGHHQTGEKDRPDDSLQNYVGDWGWSGESPFEIGIVNFKLQII